MTILTGPWGSGAHDLKSQSGIIGGGRDHKNNHRLEVGGCPIHCRRFGLILVASNATANRVRLIDDQFARFWHLDHID